MVKLVFQCDSIFSRNQPFSTLHSVSPWASLCLSRKVSTVSYSSVAMPIKKWMFHVLLTMRSVEFCYFSEQLSINIRNWPNSNYNPSRISQKPIPIFKKKKKTKSTVWSSHLIVESHPAYKYALFVAVLSGLEIGCGNRRYQCRANMSIKPFNKLKLAISWEFNGRWGVLSMLVFYLFLFFYLLFRFHTVNFEYHVNYATCSKPIFNTPVSYLYVSFSFSFFRSLPICFVLSCIFFSPTFTPNFQRAVIKRKLY